MRTVNSGRDITVKQGEVVLFGAVGCTPIALDLSPDRPDFMTSDGVLVWMERKKIKARFLDVEGKQIGPWHTNFVPAIIWALNEGWTDPTMPDWWNEACIAEVRNGGAQRGPIGSGEWEPPKNVKVECEWCGWQGEVRSVEEERCPECP